ncbi:hypothetical protein Lepto7376_2034 [[Leptolyngbya] sp. PCC 7376]|uniref:hypothetical protein n=1 Tax=[Leptolyngbya] sp. PCC 7376 TaxID=111781 RepID=UPI00029EF72A|nr:hypothetical protein [[Leptolyngbya] sp. PCC 7376]AFY38336.1 hypothetical protein Lepto7376_2034 [[Leptolyngbya] sp. PCC 7376]
MAKRHFLELARNGEAQAIATLINRNLHPKGIFAIVKYELGYLQICLEGQEMMRRASLMRFIREGLKRLDVNGVRLVRVYGRRKGESFFCWHDCFTLSDNPPKLTDLDVTPDDVKQLARQGDLEAIALLLNDAISHKQWNAIVEIKDGCLKIDIHGETAPDSDAAVTLATRLIAKIRSAFFNRVEIRGYSTNPELLHWLDSFENEDQEILEKSTMPKKSTIPPNTKTNSDNRFMIISKIKTWF